MRGLPAFRRKNAGEFSGYPAVIRPEIIARESVKLAPYPALFRWDTSIETSFDPGCPTRDRVCSEKDELRAIPRK